VRDDATTRKKPLARLALDRDVDATSTRRRGRRTDDDDGDPTTGISRDSLHKRRATGGKQKPWRKKRK